METIGDIEAKATFDALLDRVAQGEEVTITREGKPVARMTASSANTDQADAMRAVEEIKELRRGATLGGISFRELIDDGRR